MNRADYFTKHHSPAHHKRMRPLYVSDSQQVMNSIEKHDMRGCINPISTYVDSILRHINYTQLDKDTCNNLTLHKVSTYECPTIHNNCHPFNHTCTCNNIPSFYDINNDAHESPKLQPQINRNITHNLISCIFC